jgi:hypothetical protein
LAKYQADIHLARNHQRTEKRGRFINMSKLVVLTLIALMLLLGNGLNAQYSTQSTSPDSAWAEKSWTVEAMTGIAYSFKTRLNIEQTGQPDISFKAKYDTKPFTTPWYYDVRVGKWKDGKAWEIELLHHKLYLTNNPVDVQHFEVTHGYNYVTLNRAELMSDGLIFRYGVGVIVAHTENTVRNQVFNSNFRVAGPAVQVAIAKRFMLTGNLFANVEGKVTAAYARVPVAEGHATTPNVAAHLLAGIGYAF